MTSQNTEKEKKITVAFSLSPSRSEQINAAAEREMGGNKSKWLDKVLDAHFEGAADEAR